MFSDSNAGLTARASLEKALSSELTDAELATLARSDEAMVRAAVAGRPQTPLTMLLKLAQDESAEVRIGVARNPRTDMPEDLHDELSRDKSVDVVFALIGNPAVSSAIIGRLARQFHKEYAAAARDRLAAKGGAAKVLGRLGIPT